MWDELFHFKSGKKPIKILFRYVYCAICLDPRWPAKPTTLSSLVVESKSIFIPLQYFDFIFVSVTEDKERSEGSRSKFLVQWQQVRRWISACPFAAGQIHGCLPVHPPDHRAFTTCRSSYIRSLLQLSGTSNVNSP